MATPEADRPDPTPADAQELLDELDELVAPPVSKQAAIDFLEGLVDQLDARLGALREEVEEEEEEAAAAASEEAGGPA